MGLRERLSIWASRDNYDDVMEYLSSYETKHAPVFDFEHAPIELCELIAHAFQPRGEEHTHCGLIYGDRRKRIRVLGIADGVGEVGAVMPVPFIS